MSFIAVPIRLDDRGLVRRCDARQVVLSMLRIMANTPHGSWPGSPHFGFREMLETSRTRSESTQFALEEINRTLDDLNVSGFRVDSITRGSSLGAGLGEWTIVVSLTAEPGQTFSFGLVENGD